MSLTRSVYHFGLLLLEGTETLPPAHDSALGLDKVSTDLVETLLLFSGPAQEEGFQSMNTTNSETPAEMEGRFVSNRLTGR